MFFEILEYLRNQIKQDAVPLRIYSSEHTSDTIGYYRYCYWSVTSRPFLALFLSSSQSKQTIPISLKKD